MLRSRLKSWLRRWLGVDDELATLHQRLESQLIALTLETAARMDGLRDTDQTNVAATNAAFEEFATKYNDLARIVLYQQDVLRRWAAGSEVLRGIESRHKASQAQDAGKILTLPHSRIIGGN